MYANGTDRWRLPRREIYNHATSPGIFPVKYNPAAEQRERGDGGGGLNMKGKMIWRRRRKVDIWWRRSAVNGMAEGQSAGRINGSGAVIGGRSHEMPQGRRGGFTSQVTFSLGNLLIKKGEKTLRSPWGLLGSSDPRLVQDSTGIIQLNNCYRITK